MTDSCPIISIGQPVPLSPTGEIVVSSKVAYFNNGDYVAIWTEKTSQGPRLEFQLFKNNNKQLGCTVCSGIAVYPFNPNDQWLRLGATAVDIYDDYTFAIAWSALTKTGAPWQINVKTYKYDVGNANYQRVSTYNSLVLQMNIKLILV
jgi:hypothetical protein